MLLFAVDIRLAGSLSLAVSLPTMLVALGRYSRDAAFGVLREQRSLLLWMALGSVAGTVVGGLLRGVVSSLVLVPLLALLLVLSAAKVWGHGRTAGAVR